MLSCKDLTVSLGSPSLRVLHHANVLFDRGGMNAVIGPSGCGKTVLVRSLLQLNGSEAGDVFCGDQSVKSPDDLRGVVAYVPQFTQAPAQLTVRESLEYAMKLYVADRDIHEERLEHILELIGLAAHEDKSVQHLSGGQLRRLGLGLEMTTDPSCMICDEVTSGLDPQSEDKILELLRHLSREKGKTFINIIHNLGKLDYFDSIVVVYAGRVIFQGSLKELRFYFGLEDVMKLYETLEAQEVSHWEQKWGDYTAGMDYEPEKSDKVAPPALPSFLSQVGTLLERRFRLLFRDRGYLMMTLAITIAFPCIVVLFALGGLPDLERLSVVSSQQSFLEKMEDKMEFRVESLQTSSLVSGLVMFQVVLLTLMASNTGAREIAAERKLFEKERLNGLVPEAYACSKIGFTSLIAIMQGVAMTLIVKWVCEFPGPLITQLGILCICCVSMTIIALGFSAISRSAERASLMSIYLVGFQLPLSGVVLALPDFLVWVIRPFINAYWSWSGYVTTMKDNTLYTALVHSQPDVMLVDTPVAALVLGIQCMCGMMMVFWGCHQRQW